MTGQTARKIPWGGVVGAVVFGLLGLVVGAIGSANYVISVVGHPDGYEAGPIEVFQYSPVGGVINALIMVGGPVLGAWFGWVVGRRGMR